MMGFLSVGVDGLGLGEGISFRKSPLAIHQVLLLCLSSCLFLTCICFYVSFVNDCFQVNFNIFFFTES